MSVDATVWAPTIANPLDILPNPASWTPYHSSFGDWVAYEADGWQILVHIEKATPGAEVLQIVPAAQVRYDVTLEPIGAPQLGYEMFDEVCRMLAISLKGCLEDSSGQIFAPE